MKLLGLIRVSTEGQGQDDKGGIPRQKASLERIASNLGVNIEILPPIIDVGGADLSKSPEWANVIQSLKADPNLFLAVDSVDRLVRADKFDLSVLANLQTIRPIVYTSSGPNDLRQPTGGFLAGLLGLIGGLEKSQIKQRTMGAREAIREAGGFASAAHCLPYGILYSRNRRGWGYDALKISQVKKAFELYANHGLSLSQVAKEVGARGRESVKAWLSNTIYKGLFTYSTQRGMESYPTKPGCEGRQTEKRKREQPLVVRIFAPSEQVVDDDLWAAAYARLIISTDTNRRNREKGAKDLPYSGYLYSALETVFQSINSGIIDFGFDTPTRHVIYGRHRHAGETIYGCRCKSTDDPNAPSPCGLPYFPARSVNTAIDNMFSLLCAQGWYKESLKTVEIGQDETIEKQAKIKRDLDILVKKERRLVDLHVDGAIDRLWQTFMRSQLRF